MADLQTLLRIGELMQAGYNLGIASWVQVDPENGLTTLLNAFNTLGNQSMEIMLIDQDGNAVAPPIQRSLQPLKIRSWDLESMIPADKLPFEGSAWVWSKGDTDEGDLGLQAIDTDFIDRNRTDGHVMGTAHLMLDFFNTLGLPPYADLISNRILIDETEEGSPRYQNFLGLAHMPLDRDRIGQDAEIVVTVTNESGEVREATGRIRIKTLGSWFGALEAIIPDLADFLRRPGERRGAGTLNVRFSQDIMEGLCGMIKVVDVLSGSMLVDHLFDRNFSRPAMKEN